MCVRACVCVIACMCVAVVDHFLLFCWGGGGGGGSCGDLGSGKLAHGPTVG